MLNFFRLWAPEFLVGAIENMSFLTHYDQITKGVIDLADVVFFCSLIVFWFISNTGTSSGHNVGNQ